MKGNKPETITSKNFVSSTNTLVVSPQPERTAVSAIQTDKAGMKSSNYIFDESGTPIGFYS